MINVCYHWILEVSRELRKFSLTDIQSMKKISEKLNERLIYEEFFAYHYIS